MAKKTQIDRAIDELNAKRDALLSKVAAEAAGIDAAIEALKAQRPRARKKKTPESATT